MGLDYGALSDEELISQADIPGAFAELESRYLWLVRAKACKVSSRTDREDLMQEGLLSLYDAAKTYEKNLGASFATYAGICIYSRMSNAARRDRSQKHAPLNNSISLEDAQCFVPSPEAALERREDFEAVLNQIHISLSDFERKVLALYLSGYKRSEIPAISGVSIKAFDNALGRARKKLKFNEVG